MNRRTSHTTHKRALGYLACVVLLVLVDAAWRQLRSPPRPAFSASSELPAQGTGNRRIASFRAAKKHAWEIARAWPYTFYCGCRFEGKLITPDCPYRSRKDTERAHRIEWEHVVPASAFGRQHKAWREGHPDCVSASGRPFKGRRCARRVDAAFRYAEADLYNLVPAIGAINGRRGAKKMGLIAGHNTQQRVAGCASLISHDRVEPRDAVKGFVARTYFYMDKAYPHYRPVDAHLAKMLRAWDQRFPPQAWERKRAAAIAAVQDDGAGGASAPAPTS